MLKNEQIQPLIYEYYHYFFKKPTKITKIVYNKRDEISIC